MLDVKGGANKEKLVTAVARAPNAFIPLRETLLFVQRRTRVPLNCGYKNEGFYKCDKRQNV